MGWEVWTPSGVDFAALATDEFFLLAKAIANLDTDRLCDSAFLLQLLRWQNEMALVRFVIDDSYTLSMAFSRSTEDLDMSEVQAAILHMVAAVDALYGVIVQYLS